MRCSGWSSLAISVCSAVALIVVAPAGAHVVAVRPYIATGSTAVLSLASPNERSEPMTGFKLTVPKGFVIEHVHAPAPWEATIAGSTVNWKGSALPAGATTDFAVQLEATAEPGPAQLDTEQLYPGGKVVRWPVAITVTPGAESPSQNLGLAAIVGLMGLLVLTAVVVLAWRRRTGSLQEK